MRESKESAGSSFRYRAISRTAAGATTTKAGENPSDWSSTTASPNFPFSVSKIACASTGSVIPSRLRAVILLLHDDLLQAHDPVDQRLGARGAAGDVDVHGDQQVHALHHAVRILVERSARVGARPHRDHVFRLRHLFVEPLHPVRHLV